MNFSKTGTENWNRKLGQKTGTNYRDLRPMTDIYIYREREIYIYIYRERERERERGAEREKKYKGKKL